MKRLVVGVVLLAVALVVALVARIWVQNEKLKGPPGGSGLVEGTTVDVSARMAARVVERRVDKGDSVKAGDVLVTLDCREPEARLAQATAQLAATDAQAGAATDQARAAARASEAARAASQASSAQVSALSVQQGVAARQAERVTAIGPYATAARHDQATSTAEGLDYQLSAATSQRAAAAEQAEGARAQAEAAAANASAAARGRDVVAASIALANVGTSECVLTAPRAGVVEDVYVEPGELVLPGSKVLRLVVLDEVKVRFYLPNAELSAITTLHHAEVVADAWPGVTFAGTLRTVASEAEFTPRNIQTRRDRDRLVYPVELRVPNPEHRLRPGMPVEVTLVP